MPEPLLNVMKIMLLAGLYLFFVAVLRSVYAEIRDPRTRVPRRGDKARPVDAAQADARPNVPNAPNVSNAPNAIAGTHATTRRPAPDLGPVPVSVAVGGAARGPVDPSIQVGQLTILEPPPLAGLTWALGNEITLGRAPTCGVHLDDTYVSNVHARIFNRNGMFMVEDLDSRNGSVLNGAPLTVTTALQPGDRVQLGATILEFS